MSLSEVHNPKAAGELLNQFRKRFKTKVCMAPYNDHEGQIVSAHTLSVEAMLRKIAKDSNVYSVSPAKRIAKDTFPLEIKLLGLRDVSVFYGFCKKHDYELFKCLETEPFYFKRKQLFMLAYRNIARECYLKRKQAESIPTPENYATIHGLDEEIELSEEYNLFKEVSLQGAKEVEAIKATLDSYLLSESWDRLVTKAIIFKKTPSVIATSAFLPFFDMDGNKLQDFENLEAEMSHVCMSVIPLESGGAAIFSWRDTSNSAPNKFFKSIATSSDISAAIIHVIFDNTENFAMNPDWYESLTNYNKNYVFSRIINLESNAIYSRNPRPENSAPILDDWGITTISDF